MFTLEVGEDMELENFKALCEFESGVPAREITIVWNGRPLQDDKKKLKDFGIKDGEVLLLQRLQTTQGQRTTDRGPGSSGSGAMSFPGCI